jgi:hypothetical protein
MALSIGLVLAGCEGPAGADGSPGGGGGGGPGSSSVHGTVSAQVLQALLDTSSVVYVDGTTAINKSGAVTIPAGKTLKVVGGALTLGDGGSEEVILNAVQGTLDLSDAAAIVTDDNASAQVVILPAGYAAASKVVNAGQLIKPAFAATKADVAVKIATGAVAVYGSTIGETSATDITALGSSNTL